jgi:hypothetical protein
MRTHPNYGSHNLTTSGKLIDSLSDVLHLPRATIVTAMKGLRPANLVSVRGRGTSAAEMTSGDASVILIALGSGAATSYVADATKLLMEMPLRFSFRPKLRTVAALRQSSRHPFYSMTGQHPFFDGLNTIIRAELPPPELIPPPERFDDPLNEKEYFNALEHPEKLSLTIGMDLQKTGGFALLQTGSWSGVKIFNAYSTWPVKAGHSDDAFPDLVNVFETQATGFTTFHFKGGVLAAAVKALKEPSKKTRVRKPRKARMSRR